MAYDHARKAGNQGDVWKHFILVTVAEQLAADPFRYIDTHSGAPSHRLAQTGEWKRGIGRVLDVCDSLHSHDYVRVATAFAEKQSYPAGWRFVAEVLSPLCEHVEIDLTDNEPAVAERYKGSPLPSIPANVKVSFLQKDGFEHLEGVTEADLVLIDPPFHPNASSDWRRVTNACRSLYRHIPFLAWYPIFSNTHPTDLVNEAGCTGWEVLWARMGPKPSQNLKGCGMLASPEVGDILRAAKADLEKLASCLEGQLVPRKPDAH